MIRVLQVVNDMQRAGLETMLMNYYRNIDRSKIQFDFLTHRPNRAAYDDEIEAMGGKMYYAPRLYPQNYPKYFRFMQEFFAQHPEYRIVHSHIDAMSAFPLYAAKRSNVPVRISHSHNTRLDKDAKIVIKYFAKNVVPKVANEYWACGEMAGKFMYGEQPFHVLRNAIELEKFQYNVAIRDKVRRQLGIESEFVVGHVGRYCPVKNQSFLLDVFKSICEKEERAHLLLIGIGEEEVTLRKKAEELGIAGKVTFLVNRSDVNELYQAMDVFVMPSLYEGLPVVCVEAQTNGLPCIVADRISDEVLLSSSIQLKSLSDGKESWADEILSVNRIRSTEAPEELRANGYDIKREAKILSEEYLRMQYETR